MAKPFLKWAGGKRQLLPELISRFPADIRESKTYIEPFVGAGAVLFHLLDSEEYQFENFHIIDINPELILCYQMLQSSASSVWSELYQLIDNYPENHEDRKDESISGSYYNVRKKWNLNAGIDLHSLSEQERALRVAQTIFLNRTCFNGLFRVNQKGGFNVPIGDYRKLSFPSEKMLLGVQVALKDVNIHLGSFEMCLDLADQDTFIYFDPPYQPISKTSAFTSYSKEGFGQDELKKLSELYWELHERGSLLMMSNSDTGDTQSGEDWIGTLFHTFDIDKIGASRSINSKGNSRGKINEVIVKNSLTNKEVISHLNGLMVPGIRYTAREMSQLLYENIKVNLSKEDLAPMNSDTETSPRYHRMVKNACRCSPDVKSHQSNNWPELRVDATKSTKKKMVYFIEKTEPEEGEKVSFHRELSDGKKILFGRGRIDDWCVYIEENGKRRAPRDVEYFSFLEKLSDSIGRERVYSDFIVLWEPVTKTPDSSMHNIIDGLVSLHPTTYRLESTLWYTVLYMAMVSEENYRNTKLGKRLKRLGVHQMLVQGMSTSEAANWSRGKRWRVIAQECESFGF